MLRFPWKRAHASTGLDLWPVLALLLLAVLLPTAGLLWFMNRAMRSETAATQLRLTDAYQSQIQAAALSLQQYWRLKEETWAGLSTQVPAPERFAALVRTGTCDSVLILDPTGAARYPESAPLSPPRLLQEDPEWARARKAEFEARDFRQASRLYERLARAQGDAQASARAWLAQARSLLKASETNTALAILTQTLTQPRYRNARDEQGRIIAPSALLLAIENVPDRDSGRARRFVAQLEARLLDYSAPTLPSSQRRFLWGQLTNLAPGRPTPDVLQAEQLAAAYLAHGGATASRGLERAHAPGVWAIRPADGPLVVLLREERIVRDLEGQLRRLTLGADVRWELRPPQPSASSPASPFNRRLDDPLRDWLLTLRLTGPDPFAAAARRRATLDAWTAGLAIASIALLTLLAGRGVSRRMRVTRLKDDLLATVSHELRTPLSSMSVLVDTLLDGDPDDPQRTREYLEIIRRENERLSALIESFLTFSRMERGRHVFTFSRVAVSDVINRTVASMDERLRAPGCRFDLSLAPDLPTLEADGDALMTMVRNLLDNALKYTGAEKHIALRAEKCGHFVSIEVADNGVGFSRKVARRVFDRFFQGASSGAGSAGGVGLGLSIVRSIVSAHKGRITVASQPDQGSRFTVLLPVPEGG